VLVRLPSAVRAHTPGDLRRTRDGISVVALSLSVGLEHRPTDDFALKRQLHGRNATRNATRGAALARILVKQGALDQRVATGNPQRAFVLLGYLISSDDSVAAGQVDSLNALTDTPTRPQILVRKPQALAIRAGDDVISAARAQHDCRYPVRAQQTQIN
jgi:hypothetical protein